MTSSRISIPSLSPLNGICLPACLLSSLLCRKGPASIREDCASVRRGSLPDLGLTNKAPLQQARSTSLQFLHQKVGASISLYLTYWPTSQVETVD